MNPAGFDALASGPDFGDDGVLIRGLEARDPDAFAFLLDRYHGPLLRLARQYVPSPAVAEEVVQQTWLAVIQSIHRFERRASVKTWLFRILINTARAHGVKEGRTIPFSSVAALEGTSPQSIRTASGAGAAQAAGSTRPIPGPAPSSRRSVPKCRRSSPPPSTASRPRSGRS